MNVCKYSHDQVIGCIGERERRENFGVQHLPVTWLWLFHLCFHGGLFVGKI